MIIIFLKNNIGVYDFLLLFCMEKRNVMHQNVASCHEDCV